MSNTAIWDALGKTDPSQTKRFSRAGGFKGTAIKPIWIVRRLTEQFGPVGEGWGIGKPAFETIHSQDGEVLVYCTVDCWHTRPGNVFYGVGGDKVVTKRQSGMFADDEAFKKAFTDAVGNAFKFLGVGADVHMGLFDDSKYVDDVAEEFARQEAVENAGYRGAKGGKMKLKAAADQLIADLRKVADRTELEQILSAPATQALKESLMKDWPGYFSGEGFPPEFEPIGKMVTRLRTEMPEYQEAAE